MKEYMLVYKGGDPDWMENTSPEDMAASMERWGAWMADLEAKGQLSNGGAPLHYSGKNLTSDGTVTDVSLAEIKELVTGFSIIKAANMDEAIEIAKVCPIFAYPDISVEIREVACPEGES